MSRRLLILIGALAAGSAFASQEVLMSRADGVPTFVRGQLGQLEIAPTSADKAGDAIADAAKAWLGDFALANFQALGDEKFVATAVEGDELGMVHVRFTQELNGLKVDGASIIVHADATTGEVYAVNGDFVPNRFVAKAAIVEGGRSISSVLRQAGIRGSIETAPELAYIFDDGNTTLAWKTLVAYKGENGDPARDWFYVDATNGSLVTQLATIHSAKSWRSYSANNGTSLPGTLRCTGTQTCGGDVAVQAAHDNASATYDYYNVKFGRDSLNNAGLTLTSTAHYSSNYNNAFWNSSQMVYGDGDGSTFIALSRSLDVVAHELTHGVTEYTSGLVYNREPGALNEALSDIFGAATEAWVDGGVSADTWKLGEDIYTPGVSGDALRFMDNPTADGYSADYYPERLYPSCSPNQNNDYCGVHGNSGIANLAFKLLVTGGTHPRNKTTVNVPGIGMSKAEQIFYRAQVNYLTSSTTFEGARNATAQAATDLYGSSSAEVNAVHQAWCAVGVPGCPSGGGGGGGSTSALENGVAKTGLSGATGSMTYYTIAIPAGATNLSVAMSGGTGDADLYVRFGSQPTTSTYDCRPYKNGNAETCSFASPSAGTYHVAVRAYSAYSGVSLVATWTAPGGGGGGSSCTLTTSSASNLSGAQNSTANYTVAVPSSCGNLTVAMSGGTGDADLYVKFGSAPTTSSYNCRPYKSGNNETCTFSNPSAGTWYIMIRGYRAYSGVNLSATYGP